MSRPPDITQEERALRLASVTTLDIVTGPEGLPELKADYERLNRATGNTLPFALHEWHVIWCAHFLERTARIHDQLLFHVLRNPIGECVALIPLIVSRRRFGPMRIVSISLLGADPAITEIRTPLIEAGYEAHAARAVRNSLAQARDWDWIHWTGIDGAFGDALGSGGALKRQRPLFDYVIDLPPTWEEFRAGLKRNIRESLRHCYNSLKRGGHSYELIVAQESAAVHEALARFLELHVMRSRMLSAVMHPNHFATHTARDFLYAVCERLAERGAVRLFQLKVNDEIVATRIGFVVGESLYLYYSGFDPAWSKFSVMTTTVAEALKYSIAQGWKMVNLSPGTDASKTRWRPRVVEYAAALEQRDRLRSRIARDTYVKASTDEGLQGQVLRRLIRARRTWH